MDTQKKITLATFKSFCRKNKEQLHILVRSDFDPMSDCVTSTGQKEFRKAKVELNMECRHTLGIEDVWLVGGSRDYFYPYEDEKFVGIRVGNSCGAYTVAIPKG